MKILIIEDSNEKYMALSRVLKRIGVTDPTWVTNLQDGLKLIVEEENKSGPFDFVITDMNYPPAAGAPSDYRSGKKLAEAILEQGLSPKVVLCSSQRYEIPGVHACIWYSKFGDWEGVLRRIITAR